MKDFLSALRSGFGFLTTIPVGITMEGIENLMKHIYLFPVVGTVLGIILATVGFISFLIFPPLIACIAVILAIYYFSGINHIDGLADFGDGIAAHGTKEKKIAAMRDTAIGTGGLFFCMVTVLGIFTSLLSIAEINLKILPYVLLVAETGAKQSMITVAAFGSRLHEGFGAMTIDNTKISDFAAGMLFSGTVSYLALGITGIEAFIVSQLAGLLVLNAANRHFGGVSGDVIGASNEIGRLSVLMFAGVSLWMRL